MIGNAKYHCSCVRYVSPNFAIVIVIICVAVAVLLVLLVTIVVTCVICRRRQKKQPGHGMSGNNGETSLNVYNTGNGLPDEYAKDYKYSRRLPSDNEATDM